MSIDNKSNEEKIEIASGYYNMAQQKKDLADYCINTGRYQQAIPLDYYYIFNLCRIIYSLEYKDTSSHKTLLGDFNKIYIHTNHIFDKSMGSFLHTLEKQRGMCDYEAKYSIDKEFANYLHTNTGIYSELLLNYIKEKHNEIFIKNEYER